MANAVILVTLFFIVCIVVFILVLRSTLARKGRMGVNLKPRKCTKCGEPSPGIRIPANLRQALWGGWRCSNCFTEFDKWGNVIARIT